MALVKSPSSGIEMFLQWPEYEPALDYYDGRAIQKMSPKLRHSIIHSKLHLKIANYIESSPHGGDIFVELRCTFRKRSLVFDLSYYRAGRVPKLVDDERADVTEPPDLAIEILSPGQTLGELKRKVRSALRGGVGQGWLIDSNHKQILIFHTARKAQVLKSGGVLSAGEALPGFELPVDEIFGWLK